MKANSSGCKEQTLMEHVLAFLSASDGNDRGKVVFANGARDTRFSGRDPRRIFDIPCGR